MPVTPRLATYPEEIATGCPDQMNVPRFEAIFATLGEVAVDLELGQSRLSLDQNIAVLLLTRARLEI